MSNKFKEGDLVFELSFYSGITLTKLVACKNDFYPLEGKNLIYTTNGFELEDAGIPNLLHATPENREKLVAIWGEDAVPELPPSPNEIMIELLKGGSHTAMFADTSHEMARKNGYVALIDSYDENSGYFYSSNHKWKYVIAVDSRGNEITELGGDDE